MQYQTTPQQIQAVQWTGDNQPEVIAFCGDHVLGRNREKLFLTPTITREPVIPGHYIILEPGGHFSVATEPEFTRRYQPVTAEVEGPELRVERQGMNESRGSSSSLPTLNPQLSTSSVDGKFVVMVPVLLEIPVDPIDGFTEEEAPQIALDRLAELELTVTLGGVILEAVSPYPLFADGGGKLRVES